MNEDWWSGRTLQRTHPTATQFYRATRTGNDVMLEAWKAGKPPKATHKSYATKEEAAREMYRALRKKMLEDYVFLDARSNPTPGSLVFACALPGGGPADNFDITPDNRTLFIGAGRGDPTARVIRADLATGAIRRFDVAPDAAGNRQLFVHGAVAHPSGKSGWFGLNVFVRAVDLETGTQTDIASVVAPDGYHHVNPHCVELQRDARHARVALVHGVHLDVRDLDTGATIQPIPLPATHDECRKIALSPSGEIALVYCVTPNQPYSEAFAKDPARHHIRVIRVRDGKETLRIALGAPGVEAMSLSPDDATLVYTSEYSSAITCVDLATGASREIKPDPDARFARSLSWTPSGLLTLHHIDGCACFDVRAHARVGAISHAPLSIIAQRHLLSADGTRLVVGGDGTFLVFAIKPPT